MMPPHFAPSTDTPPPTALLLRTIRDARFPSGIACVHCGHAHVVRWGSFSGRQRYRCCGCRRTFSDLTGTPLAYTKRLQRWPRHFELMRACLSVRASAEELQVHPCTAFRWRHATLRGMVARETHDLCGIIELREVIFLQSRKGARSVGDPRPRGARLDWRLRACAAREHVALLRSRDGQLHEITFRQGILTVSEAEHYFRHNVAPGAYVLSDQPRGVHYLPSARRAGHTSIWLCRKEWRRRRDPLLHTDNIVAFARRLGRWLLRFRGVATRYRKHYLLWHRWSDAGSGAAVMLSAAVRPPADRRTGKERAPGSEGARSPP